MGVNMRILLLIVCITALSANASAQYNSRQQLPTNSHNNGHGWDIRLAVPGEPGSDYPTLGNIPKTSFSCAGKQPGYYADLDTNCQVFRICTLGSTYGFQSFLCPNGTLFNQQVFVCDWWMNVNCEASQKYFSNNNEKYGNLKLSPQMMNDVKKMLTYPMRNPYDTKTFRSNFVMMQEYKAPTGQLFPNSGQRSGYERDINNIYVPAKQLQSTFNQNDNKLSDNIIQASTPNPHYIPSSNTGEVSQENAEPFQRQQKSGKYVQGNQIQTTGLQPTISNSHSGGFVQAKSSFGNTQANVQNYRQHNYQNQNNLGRTRAYSTQNSFANNLNQVRLQYTNNENNNHLNSGKQAEFGISYKKERYTQQPMQRYLQQNSNEIYGHINQLNEVKENLVSKSPIPTTVITKTLTFDRLVKGSKESTPNSRLTFKSWVIKPSKTARLISEPSPYNYDRPTNSPSPTKLISEPTPYYYNKPTTLKTAKLISQPGYIYNRPTVSAKLLSETGYDYNKPTSAAKLLSTPNERLYIPPTTLRPTVPSPLYIVPTTIRPTLAGRLYLAPTTSKTTISSRLYVPPDQNQNVFLLQRQNSIPEPLKQSPYYRNADLQVAPTSPSPVYASPDANNLHKPSFTLTKHSRINTNNNNLTFTDILTKEKLDITVHDIVKDTSNILGTASSNELGQLRNENYDIEYPNDNYLPPEDRPDDNVENLGFEVSNSPKSGKLIAAPSSDLEPPLKSLSINNYNNNNPLSNLPFYKETSVPNTIERTVSIKISIPEKTAEYLFKTRNDSSFDKLEILNTGSSNYLVLTNNNVNKISKANFIPIGKLVFDQNYNFSNSQALVNSFLVDSLNTAKEYRNILDESLKPQQLLDSNKEDLAQITNKVAQLTSSQYSQSDGKTQTSSSDYNRGNVKFSNTVSQNQQTVQNQQDNPTQAQRDFALLSSRFTQQNSKKHSAKLQEDKQLYSGQLYQIPVPDVSSQIYNSQNETNFVSLNAKENGNNELNDRQREFTNDFNNKESSAEVEIIKSHSLPITSPAKLQEDLSTSTIQENQEVESADEIFRKLIKANGITAQFRDNIVGSIRHPSEDKKILTYKKDQSYYVYTKPNDGPQNIDSTDFTRTTQSKYNEKSDKLIQSNNGNNVMSFQFIPSLSFQVDDEREQQQLFNKFQINEFGIPNTISSNNFRNGNNEILTSDVDYSVDHSSKNPNGQYRGTSPLYNGPSSYSAPQSSIGRLEAQQQLGKLISNSATNKFLPAKLEQFNEQTGY